MGTKPTTRAEITMFDAFPMWCEPSLYLVHGGGVTKLGCTIKPRYRFRHLQYAAVKDMGGQIVQAALFERAGGRDVEALAIRKFSETFARHYGREYFKCSFKEAKKTMEEFFMARNISPAVRDLGAGKAAKEKA